MTWSRQGVGRVVVPMSEEDGLVVSTSPTNSDPEIANMSASMINPSSSLSVLRTLIPTFTFPCHRPSYPQTVLYQTLTQEQDSVPNPGVVVVDPRIRGAGYTYRTFGIELVKPTRLVVRP